MKKNLSPFLSTLVLALIVIPFIAGAQVGGGGSTGPGGGGGTGVGGSGSSNPVGVTVKLENPFKIGNNLYDVLQGVVNNVIIPIGGVLCVLAFIYAGFLYVTSGGSNTKIKDAHNALLYAAIGTAVLLGAWSISLVIRTTIEQLTH